MIDAGIFGSEPRVELLEGVIVDKTTKKPPHVVATDLRGHGDSEWAKGSS